MSPTPHPTPTAEELRSILPSTLLLSLFDLIMPRIPPSEPLPFSSLLHEPDYQPFIPTLRSLSVWDPASFHAVDFLDPSLHVLPDPSDPDFPKYCLGLVILLDQGPRSLFSGTDQRYINGYIDPVINKLVLQLSQLPPHLVPWNKDRWTRPPAEGGLGYHLHHYLFAHFWFMAPLTHWESIPCQDYQINQLGWAKRLLAETSGVPDPYAEQLKGELDKDTYAFVREIKAGTPDEWESQVPARLGAPYTLVGKQDESTKGDKYQFHDWFYWYVMVMHIHRPIIQTYGRYPYRNAAMGRDTTKAEEEWLDKTEHFAELKPDFAKLIKEDVQKGVWRELQAGKDA